MKTTHKQVTKLPLNRPFHFFLIHTTNTKQMTSSTMATSTTPKKNKKQQRDQKDAEESFARILQRIERNSTSSSSSSQNRLSSNRRRSRNPPNEADASDGRLLATTFLQLSNEHGVIPKTIQDSTLMALVVTSSSSSSSSGSTDGRDGGKGRGGKYNKGNNNADTGTSTAGVVAVNPAVCQAFFDTVLVHCRRQLDDLCSNSSRSSNSNNKGGGSDEEDEGGPVVILQMDSWLPSWILYTEKQVAEQQQNYSKTFSCWEDDDVDTSALDSLTIMIRAYSEYVQLKCLLQVHVTTSSSSSTTTTTIVVNRQQHLTDLCLALVTKTYLKFQTQAARLSLLRCFIHVAFNTNDDSENNQQNTITVRTYFYRKILTPLIACSVLSNTVSPVANDGSEPSSMTEAIMCMDGIWRESFSLVIECMGGEHDDDGDEEDENGGGGGTYYSIVLDLMEWLTSTLNVYVLTISSRPIRSSRIACKDFAFRWLSTLLELGGFIAEQISPSPSDVAVNAATTSTVMKMRDWFYGVLNLTIPRWYALIPSYRRSIQPILLSVSAMMYSFSISIPSNRQESGLPIVTILRLLTIANNHTIKEDVREILGILTKSIEQKRNRDRIDPIVSSMLRGIASIYLRDERCDSASKNLLQILSKTKRTSLQPVVGGSKRDVTVTNLIQFSEYDRKIFESLVKFASSNSHSVDNFGCCSAMQQSSMLMVGVGMLDSNEHRQLAFDFLDKLLSIYPHLGISVLPVLVDSINSAAIVGEGDFMMQQVNFLCDVLVRDNQCASEVWNLLGVGLMRSNIPVAIRSSVIRVFPRICGTNKRLYSRVIDSMGKILSECKDNEHSFKSLNAGGILELRLAVAANISDLAREDRIRDATDVIGWIQNFIFDPGWVRQTSTLDKDMRAGSAGLVHFAIQALHYLVVAQEMDFKLVVSVLSKRLCDVYDLKKLELLPPLVLESLILLLGDGEIEDDSDGDGEAVRKSAIVPPHVSRSVETLIGIWYCNCIHPGTIAQNNAEKCTIVNCRRNIFLSLAKYSFDALGIDEEGIQSVTSRDDTANDQGKNLPPTGERYLQLLNLVEYGITALETGTENEALPDIESSIQTTEIDAVNNPSFSLSLERFVAKLLKYEEAVIGSSLWQKRSNLRRKATKKQYGANPEIAQPQTFIKSLPSRDRILKLFNNNKCPSTALAGLLSFEGTPLDLLMDLTCERTNDASNPLLQTFNVQAWFNIARSILDQMVSSMSSSEALDQILLEIQDWRIDNVDVMYSCMSCIALFIPEKLARFGDHSSYIKDIADDVFNAYKSHEFVDTDIAKICYGFVATMDVSVGSTERLDEIVSDLEKSVVAYGGGPSFGAFYSMALICSSCSNLVKSPDNLEFRALGLDLIRRVVSFLVLHLSSCIRGDPPSLQRLASSISEGEISPEILESLTVLKKKGMKIAASKRRAANSLFISLAICVPTLTLVNDELLLGIYCMLEGLEWGSGKGFALPSVIETCRFAGLFEGKEIERMHAKYAKLLEDGMQKGVDGLDDIFFAVTSIQSKPLSRHVRKFILGNTSLFNDSGRALSLVSAVVSICSIPCLGRGTIDYKDPARLLHAATDPDVAGVVEALGEAIATREWNEYSQMATILLGFLAGVSNSKNKTKIDIRRSTEDVAESIEDTLSKAGSSLPSARSGTTLEIVMSSIQTFFQQTLAHPSKQPRPGMLRLLNSLGVLSLPGQFADMIESLMETDYSATKTACVKILISQIVGRPRAVFDGQDFVNLSLSLCRSPILKIQKTFGKDNVAVDLFINSFGESMLPKFPSASLEEASENMFRFCISQAGTKPFFTVRFLESMAALLERSKSDRSFRLSPKAINSVQIFLLRRVFAGIRDSAWTSDDSEEVTTHRRMIVDHYAKCIIKIPSGILEEEGFLKLQELDGFSGESLRIRVCMRLVQLGYFETPISTHAEIASAFAWVSRRVVSCDEEIFSTSFLHVICSISEATLEDPPDKKRDLLTYFLDNLLMVSCRAGFLALEILAAILFCWCQEDFSGSDGDSSLLCILGTSTVTWQDLPSQSLKAVVRLAVHDLPFNLARYARREKLAGLAFNRLWRVHSKWGKDVNEETLLCLRRTLIECRDAFDGSPNGSEDLVSLVKEMI